MNSRPYEDPHLMHVVIDDEDGGVTYRIECPHKGVIGSTCGLWQECTEHRPPAEPDMPEPKRTQGSMGNSYEPDSDPEAVEAWRAYWKADDAFEELHEEGPPNGNYHPVEGCWLERFVNEFRCGDGWFFHKSVSGTPIRSPFLVDYYDDGYSWEEPSPIFSLWKEPADGEQADDTADVRQP